ncbi:UDP-N-acetylmuramoyl-L-alanyl-D-glutamate--2,6-diaminopimelate ligase [Deltaproteobacteria bacterium]|nr:UDP-N-acetylmuramoyl-L-alanyl-D-glutamate--2,6-diaminopimelate ligase [Deltaproteobacteria bacterium]
MSPVSLIPLERVTNRVREGRASICTHSGKATGGDVFVSLPRAVPVGADGPDYSGAKEYILQAVKAGCFCLVCTEGVFAAVRERLATISANPLEVALAENTRAALGSLAAVKFGTAEGSFPLFGVTGTNGKTTSTYLLEAIMRGAGHVPGIIGTVAYRWPGHEELSPLTTPDCMTLHGMIADMRAAGADTAIMEVSSHAIEQERIAGLSFQGALFTNLTQDHLDYHKDMEEYFTVKARLFTTAPKGSALAVNVDDLYGKRLFDALPEATGYSFTKKAPRILRGELLGQSRAGLHLSMAYGMENWELHSPLIGEFNAYNLLGAQALALASGLPPKDMEVLENFSGVPGRLERIRNDGGLHVFVDYAHTPDALQKALEALRNAGFSRIVTVFGCGGNRDKAKRPLMGQAAAALSDVVIPTSDNPRKEDPLSILADIRPGLKGAKKIIEEADRKTAIKLALQELQKTDALLIAGKGHEPYQIIGEIKYPFSDQQIVRELLT